MNTQSKGANVYPQSTRYTGHTSLCEIDLPGQEAIRRGRVFIVGAGGLGSPVAMFLCAAGVSEIGIADSDTVSLSNLQRQLLHSTPDVGRLKVDSARDTLNALNPEVKITTHSVMLTPDNAPELLAGYDIVADCTDSPASRRIVTSACEALGLPYVFASVSRFSGMAFTHLPGTATYLDIFSNLSEEDEQPESCAATGILNTVVGITGSIQATEVLKYLASTGDLLTDRLLTFDALTMQFTVFPIASTPPANTTGTV